MVVHHLADPSSADGVVTALRKSLEGDSQLFERPWDQVLPTSEVTADGDVVVTRLGFIDPAYAFGLLRWLELPDPIAATNIL
jgi:hypothetical protein